MHPENSKLGKQFEYTFHFESTSLFGSALHPHGIDAYGLDAYSRTHRIYNLYIYRL